MSASVNAWSFMLHPPKKTKRCAGRWFLRGGLKMGARENCVLEKVVMPGLDPGIHRSSIESLFLRWMAGSSPAMTREIAAFRLHRAHAEPPPPTRNARL